MRSLRCLLPAFLFTASAYAQDYGSAEQQDFTSDDNPRPVSYSPLQQADRYQVQQGDTLWSISERFMGNSEAWPKVWSYNPEVSNPHWIYPNYVLRLTPDAKIGEQGTAEHAQAKGKNSFHGRTVERGAFSGRQRKGSVLLEHEGFLDKDALKERGDVAGSPEEHMMLAPPDSLYIRFRKTVPKNGTEVILFRPISARSLNDNAEGIIVRISGTAIIESYDPQKKLAKARIANALEPIERGFAVSPMVRRFEVVDPVKNQKNINAKVISSIHPLQNYADYQVVFVNAGGKAGVAKGNRFLVIRRGDAWRNGLGSASEESLGALRNTPPPAKGYPKETIAELLVVAVREKSATCLVIRSIQPVVSGDMVEMRQGY